MTSTGTGPPDSQRDFVRQKLDWVEQIARDGGLTFVAVRLAMVLIKYFNSKTGEAWPSNSRLAAELGVNRRTIQRAETLLVTRNHLTVVGSRRGGRGRSTHYQLRINNEKAKTLNDKPKGPKGRQGCHPFDKGRQIDPERAAFPSHKGRQRRRPNPLNEPLENSSGTDFAEMDAKGWFASDAKSEIRIHAYDTFKPAPAGALDIDTQIEKFTAFNATKKLSDEEWWRLWRAWCQQAVRRAAP